MLNADAPSNASRALGCLHLSGWTISEIFQPKKQRAVRRGAQEGRAKRALRYCRLTSSGCASKCRFRCSYGFNLKQDRTLQGQMA